jgi:aminoglycoside/choline kinase family phosphotransferase
VIDPRIRTLALAAIGKCSHDIPGADFSDRAALSELSTGGSQRYFLRLEEDKSSVVILVQPGGGEEFDDYIAIGNFLRGIEIAVPEFFFTDKAEGVLVMEDLGDLHMDQAVRNASPKEELAFYRDAMDVLFRLQTIATDHISSGNILEDRIFGEDVLLGETDYFEREFARGYAGVEPPPGWDEDRKALASALAKESRVFMHRDFQSRNILVRDGRLRIVDFQTAHRGPGLYDAASLLKDPYHPLPEPTRKTLLLEHYYRLKEAGRESANSFDEYRERFVLAGIQRNLQALAAYAYLGKVKEKSIFLESIEPAFGLLEEGLSQARRFGSIESLIRMIREKLDERK